MEKYYSPSLSTGQFAKLCGTNKRTLIHYHEIGLFSPAKIDQNGYRYYSEQQCDVFLVITALKEIGMPLKDIRSYLDTRTPQKLKVLLDEQQCKVREEIRRLKRISQLVDTKRQLIEISETVQPGVAEIIWCEEEYLVLSQPVDSDEHDRIIQKLYQHIDFCMKAQLTRGHPFGAMLSKQSVEENKLDRYAYFFHKLSKKEDFQGIYIKPQGFYAVTFLKGNYYDAKPAYDLLKQYIVKHQFRICGYSYKEGIIDEIAEKDPGRYMTRISIEVKKDEDKS